MRNLLTIIISVWLTIAAIDATGQENPNPHFPAEAFATLGTYRGLVEEHITGIRRALRVIAHSEEAMSGLWERCAPLLTQLGGDLPTDATTWFALPDGSYHGTGKGVDDDQNLRDRHYFPALMSGKEIFGDLVISKSTGHRSVIIAIPVTSSGKTVGAVGVSLRVRLLSQLVDSYMPLPEGSYFYVLERDTRIALHQKAERMFMTPSDVGDEALGAEFKKLIKERNSGSFEYSLQGKKMSAIFQESPVLDWYFFIAKELP